MSVNSFEHYPMTWKPNKKLLKAPLYLTLAELLEQDIVSGRLASETKLPPQRELADFLDINLSTITRAFKLCEQKGIIYAVIGKGTFVSPNKATPLGALEKNQSLIPLGNLRPYYQLNTIASDTVRRLLQSPSMDRLFRFDTVNDTDWHTRIAQYWLKNFSLSTSQENIFLTSGTQNALVLLFLTVFQAGDKIATDTFTYTNFISLARQFRIELIPIISDTKGILPEDLEKKCQQHQIKGIYLVPTNNNPTGATLTAQRRKTLADIIIKHQLLLIEDDTYAFINKQQLPPLASLIPDCTFYIHGLSKALFPGLRIAYMVVPDRFIKKISLTANNINTHISLLNAEITSELISSGQAQEIIQQKNRLSEERNRLYRQFFPEVTSENPFALFQWLPLPKEWKGYEVETLARQHGVEILCAERFFVGGVIEQSALRVSICSPENMAELERGLNILTNLLR